MKDKEIIEHLFTIIDRIDNIKELLEEKDEAVEEYNEEVSKQIGEFIWIDESWDIAIFDKTIWTTKALVVTPNWWLLHKNIDKEWWATEWITFEHTNITELKKWDVFLVESDLDTGIVTSSFNVFMWICEDGTVLVNYLWIATWLWTIKYEYYSNSSYVRVLKINRELWKDIKKL